MVDFPTDKIPVTVLGATGPVGQQFVRLLDGHPWFEVTAVTGDSQFAGRPYADATRWLEPEPIPDRIAAMPLRRPEPALGGRIAFSANRLRSKLHANPNIGVSYDPPMTT